MTIEVNYAVLTDSANALRRIAGEFNDAVTIKDHYGKAMGAGSIERALGTFGGNWDRHANLKPTSRIRETRDYSKIFLCGQTLAPQVAASGGLDGGLEYVDNCGPPGASMRFFGGSQKKMSTMSLDLWQRGCERLAAELPEQQFNTWIRPLAPTTTCTAGGGDGGAPGVVAVSVLCRVVESRRLEP